jgi:uncharacterized OB-fold protein
MTSPTVGPLGTHASVLGGAAAPIVGDLDHLLHTTMAPYAVTPVPTPIDQPYWSGAKEGKLVIQRCQGCKKYNHPPVAICNYCGDRNAELEFEQVSGRATLYTFYICYDTSVSGFEEKVPYAVILAELEEQADLTLMSNILNFEYDQFGEKLVMGMPLEVCFDKVNDDIYLPQFQPRKS